MAPPQPAKSTSTAAQYPAEEESQFKSPDRETTTDDGEEIFSPTSAAALALSTLCGAATASFSREPTSGGDASRQRPTSLSRTRLFNSQTKPNSNSNSYTSIHPSRQQPPVANEQQPSYNPSPSASPRYYSSTKPHPATAGNYYPLPAPAPWPEQPHAYQSRPGYPKRPPYHPNEVSLAELRLIGAELRAELR